MEKLHYYVDFTKAYPFIIGLIFTLYVVDNTLISVLVTYLEDEWTNLGLQRAVQIVNFREGLTKVAEFIVHVSDVHIGRFRSVIGLTGLYFVGLVMLAVLDPHEMKNIKLLYMAILFISLGKAGNESLKSFVRDQVREKENYGQVNEERVKWRARVWWFFPWILAACLAPFLIASWDIYKILLTVTLFVELLGFWSGNPLQAFEYTHQTNSPATKVYHILRAAILKNRSISYSMSSQGFYENAGNYMESIPPNVSYLRWIDKAAIIDPSMSVEEQVKKKLLYKVADVEEVKYVLQPTAHGLTFLLYSISQASGTTFYLDQIQKLNINFPIITFLIIKKVSAYIASNLRINIRTTSLIHIAMVFGWLSSLAALGVEAYEIHTRKIFSVHINVWWMTPQFIFLGLMEGFFVNGMERFTKSHVSESMGLFGANLMEFMIGVGRILNLGMVSVRVIYSSNFGRFYYYVFLGSVTLGNSGVATFVSRHIIKPNPIRNPTNHKRIIIPPDDVSLEKSPEVDFYLLPPVIICPVCGMVMSDGQCTKKYHLEDCPLHMSCTHHDYCICSCHVP